MGNRGSDFLLFIIYRIKNLDIHNHISGFGYPYKYYIIINLYIYIYICVCVLKNLNVLQIYLYNINICFRLGSDMFRFKFDNIYTLLITH